jgi:hypothetical protein
VRVGELDASRSVGEEHRGHGQDVVRLPRGRLEIDRVLLVLLDGGVVDAEGDAEREGRVGLGVGEELPVEVMPIDRLAELLRAIRGEGDDLVAQRPDLAFDLAQLPELRVAVGSPAAAVEQHQRGFAGNDRAQVGGFAVERLDLRRGDLGAEQQRPDRGGGARGCIELTRERRRGERETPDRESELERDDCRST